MVHRVTMEDVAEKANVSINTVSRALNDKPDINSKTKEQILRIADKLGYRPNRLARGLRSSRTQTIGVVVADIANPFFSALVKGVEEAATKKNYSIILQDTDEKYEKEKESIEVMLSEQVDGLLISPVQTKKQTILKLLQSDLPFVLLARHFDELDTNYVVADDVQGGYLATELLINCGYEKIALINGPTKISSAKKRLLGYTRALRKHNRDIIEDLIQSEAVTMEDGYTLARKLLKSNRKPDAVFAYSDFVAVGIVKAAREMDLKIPDQLAVVGYDDITFASSLEVPLTTVRMPKTELGKKAFDILCQQIGGEKTESKMQIKLDVSLIKRKSHGPCRVDR